MADIERLWLLTRAKGRVYIDEFVANMTEEPSWWTEHYLLERYGWACTYERPFALTDQSSTNMFDALELWRAPADNVRYVWRHMDATRPSLSPRWYFPTNGYYSFVVNRHAIIALNSVGPKYAAAQDNVKGEELIPLHHWSDVVFIQWKRFCDDRGAPLNELRMIARTDITNEDTKTILQEALARSLQELRTWPDPQSSNGEIGPVTFPLGSQEFEAIIGCPTGVGPAKMLAQHKRSLGPLIIHAVTVYRKTPGGLEHPAPFNLCFHISPKTYT